eukprot:scaffold1957_cov52-Attheya_sp.AAC.2
MPSTFITSLSLSIRIELKILAKASPRHIPLQVLACDRFPFFGSHFRMASCHSLLNYQQLQYDTEKILRFYRPPAAATHSTKIATSRILGSGLVQSVELAPLRSCGTGFDSWVGSSQDLV